LETKFYIKVWWITIFSSVNLTHLEKNQSNHEPDAENAHRCGGLGEENMVTVAIIIIYYLVLMIIKFYPLL